MREAFVDFKPHSKTMGLINLCNEIIDRMVEQGYSLTLRQLFYQLVRRNVIRNKQTEYKRLGKILNDARLGGLVDWNAIEDRTRHIRGINHYQDEQDFMDLTAGGFHLDLWADQEYRPEVWVEKDALVQILEKACRPLDVDYFSCRGYTSQSEIYGASKRLLSYYEAGQTPVIIHLGDHDPSGLDMTRDIMERINLFLAPYGYVEIEVRRVALNMAQIKRFNPPPNPAKNTDSRFKEYRRQHGSDCWELDALDPSYIDQLITDTVVSYRDDERYEKAVALQEERRENLRHCAKRWPEVHKFLTAPPKPPRKPREKSKKK